MFVGLEGLEYISLWCRVGDTEEGGDFFNETANIYPQRKDIVISKKIKTGFLN